MHNYRALNGTKGSFTKYLPLLHRFGLASFAPTPIMSAFIPPSLLPMMALCLMIVLAPITQVAAIDTRKVLVGCQLDFTLDRSKVTRRPNSAEMEEIIGQTTQFYEDQFAELLTDDFVDVSLIDISLPKRIGGTVYAYRLNFFAAVQVKGSSPFRRDELADLVEEFDYSYNYMENYVKNVADTGLFVDVLAINFQLASPPKY